MCPMRRMIALLAFVVSCLAAAQTAPDPALLAEIQKTRAIDNHTHVLKVTGPGEQDTEFDALPCDPLEPSGAPTMTRPENPAFLAAWKALYGYAYNDASPEHLNTLRAAQERIRRHQ